MQLDWYNLLVLIIIAATLVAALSPIWLEFLTGLHRRRQAVRYVTQDLRTIIDTYIYLERATLEELFPLSELVDMFSNAGADQEDAEVAYFSGPESLRPGPPSLFQASSKLCSYIRSSRPPLALLDTVQSFGEASRYLYILADMLDSLTDEETSTHAISAERLAEHWKAALQSSLAGFDNYQRAKLLLHIRHDPVFNAEEGQCILYDDGGSANLHCTILGPRLPITSRSALFGHLRVSRVSWEKEEVRPCFLLSFEEDKGVV